MMPEFAIGARPHYASSNGNRRESERPAHRQLEFPARFTNALLVPETVHTEHTFDLPFPRADVWPILSKTDWLNRSLGLPPVTYDIKPLPQGGTEMRARARLLGQEMRWQEMPFEWVEGEFYSVHRLFDQGPLREARLGVDFLPAEKGVSRVRVYSQLTPRNMLGTWLARRILGPKGVRDIAQIIAHVAEHLRGQQAIVLPKLSKQAVTESAFGAGLEKLRASGQAEELVRLLANLLRESADVEICRLRPFTVAREWRQDRWDVLRLFLHATRCGLLDLSWEVLCPNCRSTRAPLTTSLAGVSRNQMHCEACQIKFDAEFDKSVELKFAVHHAVRPCDAQTFCLAGPGAKPHIVSQLFLQPGEKRVWKLPALHGAHRLRSPQVKQPAALMFSDAAREAFAAELVCGREHFDGVNALEGRMNVLVALRNPNEFPVQVVLERAEWNPDILTAAQVTNWQEFRDLFAREVISPNEQIIVGNQVVLFTDLRGSTAMYNGIGDAPAYALVRDHFQILCGAIGQHHGAVVKTIGDAVMAVFSQVDDALRAVEQMQQQLAQAKLGLHSGVSLMLKVGLHLGPCLAVNANEKLDYFGTTINFAARLVDQSQGGDLLMSEEIYRRPETVKFLAERGQVAEASEVAFRGFDMPQQVWRVAMG